MGTVTVMPSAAVDLICHDDQMTVWTGDVSGALSLGGFVRDLEYSEIVDLHNCLANEIRSIVRSALDHPEARTVINQ